MTDKVWKQKFSENLVAKMRKKAMSQNKLADFSGLDASQVSKLVHGQSIPSDKTVLNLCYVLGCNADELINFGEPIESEE